MTKYKKPQLYSKKKKTYWNGRLSKNNEINKEWTAVKGKEREQNNQQRTKKGKGKGMEIRDSGYCCCFYCNEGVNIKKSNSLIFITTLLCIECAMLMVFEHDIDIIFVCSQIEIFFFWLEWW